MKVWSGSECNVSTGQQGGGEGGQSCLSPETLYRINSWNIKDKEFPLSFIILYNQSEIFILICVTPWVKSLRT